MKRIFLITVSVAVSILSAPLNAEVPKTLATQALSDMNQAAASEGKELTENMKKAAEVELNAPNSPLHLSPTALADYEEGETLVSSIVLQELVKDTRAKLEKREVALPFLAKYYLSAHDQTKFNREQKILCYLSLKVLQRKIAETAEN